MRFIVRKGTLPSFALKFKKVDIIHLQPDDWNDYGFVTGFTATLYPKKKFDESIKIGFVRILKEFQKSGTNTSNLLKEDDLLEFEKLPEEYYSLGHGEDFYQVLMECGDELVMKYSEAMNDVYIDPEIGHRFENDSNEGFEASLLRSSAAAAMYAPNSLKMLDKKYEDLIKAPFFSASIKMDGADKPHDITFDFKNVDDLPSRVFVLVGKNGVGKTQLLGELAFLISGGAKSESLEKSKVYDGNSISSRGIFQNVIAFSFSAFDDFEIPLEAENLRTSYRYWGLRDENNKLLTTEKLTNRIYSVARDLPEGRREIFAKYLEYIAPNLNLSNITGRGGKNVIKEKTSAGQRMMLATLTGLVSFLKDRSILLFDEPETHLHPSMLANLMSVINGLLEEFNSYAVVTTHSPIVLQQVPSRYVRVVRRQENTPEVDELSIETFGENITEISQEVFDVSDYERDYKDIFINLLSEHSPEEIISMFDNRLGISARTLLHSLNRRGAKN